MRGFLQRFALAPLAEPSFSPSNLCDLWGSISTDKRASTDGPMAGDKPTSRY